MRRPVCAAAQLDEFTASWSAEVSPLPNAPHIEPVPPLLPIQQPALMMQAVGPNTRIDHEGALVIMGSVDQVSPSSRLSSCHTMPQTAHVAATGDVFVWGELCGTCHAGSGGNANAMVVAAGMRPSQLRIAGVVAYPPPQPPGPPMVARIDPAGSTIQMQRALSLASHHPDRAPPTGILSPAGRVAWFTGLYITLAGLALLARPSALFGMLFESRCGGCYHLKTSHESSNASIVSLKQCGACRVDPCGRCFVHAVWVLLPGRCMGRTAVSGLAGILREHRGWSHVFGGRVCAAGGGGASWAGAAAAGGHQFGGGWQHGAAIAPHGLVVVIQ